MAFTYPLSMPATPGLKMSKFGASFNNTVNLSLNRTAQVVRRQGDLFVFEWELPPMKRDKARLWQVFGMKLNGRYGTFYGGDPDARKPMGAAGVTAAPLVNGASQTGTALVTDGWANSTTNLLLAGDYFAVGNRLKMVMDNVSSNGSGQATINISPPINSGESPADNAAITLYNPLGIFRLTSDDVVWDADHLHRYGMSFQAMEAL